MSAAQPPSFDELVDQSTPPLCRARPTCRVRLGWIAGSGPGGRTRRLRVDHLARRDPRDDAKARRLIVEPAPGGRRKIRRTGPVRGSGPSPQTTDAHCARGEELSGKESVAGPAFASGRGSSVATSAPHIDREEWMGTRRQTTMAKMARERKVQERRALKQEKKQAAAAERLAKAAGPDPAAE